MTVNAQTAQYLEIIVGANSEYEGNGNGQIECPQNSSYVGSEIAPCIIDLSGGGLLITLDIYTLNGIPSDLWIKTGEMTMDQISIYCNDGTSVNSNNLFPQSSQCWNTNTPTTDPTKSPLTSTSTNSPNIAPTITTSTTSISPTSKPTNIPSKSPSDSPTTSPNTYTPTKSPTLSPNAAIPTIHPIMTSTTTMSSTYIPTQSSTNTNPSNTALPTTFKPTPIPTISPILTTQNTQNTETNYLTNNVPIITTLNPTSSPIATTYVMTESLDKMDKATNSGGIGTGTIMGIISVVISMCLVIIIYLKCLGSQKNRSKENVKYVGNAVELETNHDVINNLETNQHHQQVGSFSVNSTVIIGQDIEEPELGQHEIDEINAENATFTLNNNKYIKFFF